MSLGGGTFTLQNKILPGTYINFFSSNNVNNLSVRGYAAIPMKLSWGQEGKLFTITSSNFERDCMEKLGLPSTDPSLLGLRETIQHATVVYLYRLNSGVKATNDLATSLYSGTKGNDIAIVVNKNIDDATKFDVITKLDNEEKDTQIVKTAKELKDNLYVVFKKDATLAETAGIPLTGGTDGAEPTASNYQNFLNLVEGISINALCCPSSDNAIKKLFIAYSKRMRNEVGRYFQTVVYKDNTADFEGVISVENALLDTTLDNSALTYWVTGITAGCEVQRSNTNLKYDGELTIDVNYTQAQLEDAITTGKFIFHNNNGEVYTLLDINTFTSFVSNKNKLFSKNQVVRINDYIAVNVATLFNTQYVGKVNNTSIGRSQLKSDIVNICAYLNSLGALENFAGDAITVDIGEDKASVVINMNLTVGVTMEQLYMTIVIN